MALRTLTLAGGALALLGGVGHLCASTAMRRDVWGTTLEGGLPHTVSLAPAPDELEVAEAFWFSVGSFGAPLAVLGGLVTWMHLRGQRVPGPVGWGVAGWALTVGLLGGVDVGSVLLLSSGVLIGIGDLGRRRGRQAAATVPLGAGATERT